MKNQKEMVLNTSDEAATYQTGIKGWVSRRGNFYGDSPTSEEIARYDGCTHRPCKECGAPALKVYLYCKECSKIRKFLKFKSREAKVWDRITPLYSDAEDEYFMTEEELIDYMRGSSVNFEDLQLLICEPNYLQYVDEDYWADELYEDCELPLEVYKALDNLNKEIDKVGPVSWSPGKFRAVLEGIK